MVDQNSGGKSRCVRSAGEHRRAHRNGDQPDKRPDRWRLARDDHRHGVPIRSDRPLRRHIRLHCHHQQRVEHADRPHHPGARGGYGGCGCDEPGWRHGDVGWRLYLRSTQSGTAASVRPAGIGWAAIGGTARATGATAIRWPAARACAVAAHLIVLDSFPAAGRGRSCTAAFSED